MFVAPAPACRAWPQEYRRGASAGSAANGRSPGTGHYFGDRANSETQSVLHPRYTHARAALPLARFTNARLTTQQHYLAHASRLCAQRSRSSVISASRPTRGVKPVTLPTSRRLCAALSPRMRYTWTGSRHTLEGVHTKLVVGKVSLHQSEGGGTNDDGIGRCESLEPGRHVGRLPQG